MSDMKLIMESWRGYNSIDEQYDEALAYFLESYNGLLTEGEKEDIISSMKPIIKQFGKKAVTAVLIASFVLGIPKPALAQTMDDITGFDLPVAAQQMDASEAAATMKTPVGKAFKDVFGKDGKLDKFGKDTFGKDGKFKDLLKKKDKDADDTPDAEPEGELIGSYTSQDGTFALKQAELNAKRNGNDVRQLQSDGLLGVDKTMNNDGDVTVKLYKLDTPKPTPDLKAMVKKNLESN